MLIKVWFALVLLWTSVNSYKILVALPTTFKSHYQFGSEISKALAAEGHEVTVISPFKQAKPLPNYDEVHLEHTVQATKNSKSTQINANYILTILFVSISILI